MKTIDDIQRRKIFGLLKTAHEQTASPLSREAFRHELMDTLGIESLSHCPAEQGLKLMNRLHQMIEETAPAGHGKPSPGRQVRVAGHSHEGQLRKIYALLTDMSLSWEYADGMALRMYRQKFVEQLHQNELRGVIAALTKRQMKHGGRRVQSTYKAVVKKQVEEATYE